MKRKVIDKSEQIINKIDEIEKKFYETFRPKSTDIGDRVKRNYNTFFDQLSKVIHSREI